MAKAVWGIKPLLAPPHDVSRGTPRRHQKENFQQKNVNYTQMQILDGKLVSEALSKEIASEVANECRT